MKKYFVLIPLFLITSQLIAQKTYFAVSYKLASLNSSKTRWIWESDKACNIMITIDAYDVYIDNSGQTSYRIISQGAEEKRADATVNTWVAIDDEKNRCKIKLVSWTDGSPWQLYITYPTFQVAYSMSTVSK